MKEKVMQTQTWFVVSLMAVGALSVGTAATARAAEDNSVDRLVEEAQEVSIEPLDSTTLEKAFGTMSATEAQAFIDTRLVADTTTLTVITPTDATARATQSRSGTPTAAAPRASGCWSVKATNKATAATGNTLYT
jgi:hypothetical protein